MLGDSTYFDYVKCMNEYDGDIYVSLAKPVQIARLDDDLNFKTTIGQPGRGPQEFLSVNKFTIDKDVIWVGDPGKNSFVRFATDGKYLNAVEKSRMHYTLAERFAVEDGKVYFSQPDLEKKRSLAVLDLDAEDDRVLRQFGGFTDFQSPTKDMAQNRRHIFVTGDYIIAVPKSLPVIEKYDKQTLQLVETYDVTIHPMIKEVYALALNNPDIARPNVSYELLWDAYLHDDKLYVVYLTDPDSPKDKRSDYNGILVFEVGGETKLVKQYLLEDELMSLCVTDSYIYGAPTVKGQIKRYPLNQNQ